MNNLLSILRNVQRKNKLTEKTPLYFVVDKGNQEIVQMIIDHINIDINLKSVFNECYNNYLSNEENIMDYITFIWFQIKNM